MVAIEIGESTADDLKFILSWLEAEEDDTSNGFWCNRGIVEDSHAEGGMLVLREDGVAVAFQLGALVRPGIIEVRPDCRGRGYGRKIGRASCRERVCQYV